MTYGCEQMSDSEHKSSDPATRSERAAGKTPEGQGKGAFDALAAQMPYVGVWRRTSGEACAQAYPQTLAFRDDGVYLASSDDDAFREWQAGDFRLEAEGVLKMQLSNDAMGQYRYQFAAPDRIVFEDPMGCRIAYQKVE